MAPNCTPLCAFSDRLYFTTFPHPPPSQNALNHTYGKPGEAPPVRPLSNGHSLASPPLENVLYYYFTFDDSLCYNSFYLDWGPLNLAMVYKACILIHELLADEELSKHRLVLYSSDAPKQKANAALLASLYSLIVMRNTPWDAFRPIAELQFMPFRDAGRGCSDFNLSLQDCLWGVWKAIQHGLCDMSTFSVEEYEFYEKVENGDWNWITPNFLAFASPSDPEYIKQKKSGAGSSTALHRKLPGPFLNCLNFFEERGIKLVVRLNNILYDRETFTERSIDHVELFFEDGTNPTDEIVRSFIDMSDKIITAGGVVAVHCKAGLGRTGTLIGAYLIWKYGFTANEAIAFMRIARPGSVVGPQQQYMYLKQTEWIKWAAVDELNSMRSDASPQPAPSTPVKTPVTPPADDIDELATLLPPLSTVPVTPSKHVAASEAAARAITAPGQPRKTPKGKRVKENIDDDSEADDEISALPMADIRPSGSRLPRTKPRKIPVSEHKKTAARRNGIENTMGPKVGTSNLRTKPLPHKATRDDSSTSRRKLPDPPSPSPMRRGRPLSPTPSRLPQPTSNKRPLALLFDSPTDNPKASKLLKAAGTSSDAWMSGNPVVVPATKGARPLLRPVRRRRSSFSSADVVA